MNSNRIRNLSRKAPLAVVLVLAGCGEAATDLPYASESFVWRYEASAPWWDPKAATRVEKLSVFTVGDRIFAVEWSREKSNSNRTARILRIDGTGKTRQGALIGQPLPFGNSSSSGIFPVKGAASEARRLVIARTVRDATTKRFQQRVSLLTVSGHGTVNSRTNPVTIGSLARVVAAWQGPDDTILVAGADSDGKHRTLRLVLLDKSGQPRWSYLASDLPGERTRLGPSAPVAVQADASGGLALIGTDGRWSGDNAIRYIYRLTISAQGKRVGFTSLFDIPSSDLSSGTVQGNRVRARPNLTAVRRLADGSFVGLLGGWYKEERRALRIIKLSSGGKIDWLRDLTSDEKPVRSVLGVARNDEVLVFGVTGDKRQLFRMSPASKVLSTYLLPDLRIVGIQPHPKQGYLLTAIRTEESGPSRLVVLQYVPSASEL